MPTDAPAVRLDRIALTDLQLRAMELMLYQAADVINRLKAEQVVYTKLAVPPQEVPNGNTL